MAISGAIPQLRTTDLAGSIRFYTAKVGLTLEFETDDAVATADALKRNANRDGPARDALGYPVATGGESRS